MLPGAFDRGALSGVQLEGRHRRRGTPAVDVSNCGSGTYVGGIHAVAQKSTIPIALRTDCRTQKVKRFRFVALPEFIRTLLLASQRPRSTPINEGTECH